MLKSEFESDEAKAISNVLKHGIAFEEAITAFDDPLALLTDDVTHSSASESRRWWVGKSAGRVRVVVFTLRFENRYRIVSARPASRAERDRYEESR